MEIPFSKLNYKFKYKPVLVGGADMEIYNLRKSGADIDLIAHAKDLGEIIKLYPDRVKNLGGDLGVCPYEFEILKTIAYFDYEFYKEGAKEKDSYFLISLEKLTFMKSLAIAKEKYLNDVKLCVSQIIKNQSAKKKSIYAENELLTKDIIDIKYIEKF